MSPSTNRQLLSELREQLRGELDVFVCSSSYEDRCLSIPMHIPSESVRRALVCENVNIEQVGKNANRLLEYFDSRGERVQVHTGDPIRTAQGMYSALKPLVGQRENERIVVDITTFTHEQLLILLGLLRRLGCKAVSCLYSGAASYMTGDQQWLSKGIVDIRSVLGFSGDLGIRSGTKLIMLIGFEWERAQRLIEAYDPTRLALGIGRQADAIEDEHFRNNRIFFDKLISLHPHATSFEFSCNDPQFTARIIEEQCKDPILTPVVATMNTKISTVGAALAAFADARIQLCYAQAAVYNCVSYSQPGNYFRAFDIELEPEE